MESKLNLKDLLFGLVRTTYLTLKMAPTLTVSLFVSQAFIYLLPLLQAKIQADILDDIVKLASSKTLSTSIILLIVIYGIVWAGSRVISSLQVYFDKRWMLNFEQKLEIMVYKKRAEIDLAHYEKPSFQNLLQRAFNRSIWPIIDTADLQFRMTANILLILVSSVITLRLNPFIYVIVITASIPTFIVNIKYGYKMWTIWAENSARQRKFGHLRGHIHNRTPLIQNKLLQASKYIIDMMESILTGFKNDQLKVDRARLIWSVLASIFAAGGFGLAMYSIVSDAVIGKTEIGSVVFLMSALGQLVGGINQFLTDLSAQYDKGLYVKDIFSVLDTKPYVKRAKKPVPLNLKTAPTIEFRNVSFKYEGMDKWVLENINLMIKPGEKIALVGLNGAGKTTLTKLIGRIYDPTEGEILVNGVDLKKVDLDEWSSYLAILPQDYANYDFTVSESIAMGRSNSKIEKGRVEEAARLSGAHDFIDEWTDKYDQQIGKEFEGGVEPSKGQNQKIALARVLYRDGLVCVFDEPTAAMDPESEAFIFSEIEKASEGKTLILITHRFNTVQGADRIVVLEDTKIEEIGSHDQLIEKKGRYFEMFTAQAKAYID